MENQQALKVATLLAPAAAATTERTANLDCSGQDYATIVVNVSSEVNTNSTNVAIALLESDDTTASNFATFNTTYNYTIDNTSATIGVHHVDLKGRKRYLRLKVTPDTTTNGAVLSSAVALTQQEVVGAHTNNATNVKVG